MITRYAVVVAITVGLLFYFSIPIFANQNTGSNTSYTTSNDNLTLLFAFLILLFSVYGTLLTKYIFAKNSQKLSDIGVDKITRLIFDNKNKLDPSIRQLIKQTIEKQNSQYCRFLSLVQYIYSKGDSPEMKNNLVSHLSTITLGPYSAHGSPAEASRAGTSDASPTRVLSSLNVLKNEYIDSNVPVDAFSEEQGSQLLINLLAFVVNEESAEIDAERHVAQEIIDLLKKKDD